MDIQKNVGFPQEKKGKLEICEIKKDWCVICFKTNSFCCCTDNNQGLKNQYKRVEIQKKDYQESFIC